MPRIDIGKLQELLNASGFDAGGVDGDYGPRTDRALEKAMPLLRELTDRGIDGEIHDVHPDLWKVWKNAEQRINSSSIGFKVRLGETIRTIERQRALVNSGASQTMKSRHLTGHAIDIFAISPDGEVSWEWKYYDAIAEQMRLASVEEGILIEWGAAWGLVLGDMETAAEAKKAYIDRRQAEKGRPFLDGPHYQLPWDEYPA